jgi:hypothetical protein
MSDGESVSTMRSAKANAVTAENFNTHFTTSFSIGLDLLCWSYLRYNRSKNLCEYRDIKNVETLLNPMPVESAL